MAQGSALWYFAFPVVITLLALTGYRQKWMGKFILILFLFFSMFRGDHVGNDTMNYMNESSIQYKATGIDTEDTFDNLVDNFGSRTELLTIFLNQVVYNLDLPPRTIIYTYSLITMIFLFLALRRFRVNTSLGLMFYLLSGLYYFSLTAARQMAAVSIVLFAYTFLLEKDKKRYLFFLYILIAAGFHASSIINVLVFFLHYLKINRNVLLALMVGVCTVCVLFAFNVMDVVYRFFNIEYVSRYMGMYDEASRSLKGRIFDVLTYLFVIYSFYVASKEKKSNLHDSIYSVAVMLKAMFTQNSTLVARVTYGVTVFMPVYMAKTVVERKLLKNRTAIVLLLLYIVLSIYGIGTYANSSLTSGYYLIF